jgi:ABC-type branched-subunit amino acid transport system substrate-binding protein
MGVDHRPTRHQASWVLLLVLLAACGSRVGSERVSSGQRSPVGAIEVGPSGDAVSADTNPAGGPTTTATSTPTAGSAPVASSPTAAAPAGGNGGATDVGVTGETITIGNVSTLSGPVPGLFAGAVIGTQAFVAYQNSLGGVFGRKLRIDVRDDQFDTGQNRAQTVDLISRAFGLVGSFSLYDDAAVKQMEAAGIPNIQVPLTTGLQESPANFSINPVRRGSPAGPWNLFKSKFPGAIGKVGGLYGDVPAAKDSFLNNKFAAESVGYKFVYERGFQPTETDFTADVVRMKSTGVRFFFTNGDVKSVARMAKAMQQQGFKPDAFVVFGPAYDATFVPLGGAAVEGVLNIGTQAMYLGEDARTVPEIALMNQWLNRVKPGYRPDLFAAYGWGSARLFVKALQDAGPRPTRANVVAALRKINQWDGNGLFAPAGPASKRPATCFIIERVHNGRFERWESPPPGFRCNDGPFVFRP